MNEKTLPASDGGRPLIYCAEDEPEIARILCKVLDDFGFASRWFRTGAEFLRQARKEPPNLCIVDLGLPDIDGMELVRAVRSDMQCGVLILTGRDYTADRVLGLELGADDYVVKPFEPRELVARVRSILRRCDANAGNANGAGRARIAEFGDWRFDVDTNLLRAADGSEHSLSTAEAQLLRAFLERPNRILTREQLLGTRDLSPFDRSIDVRISRLRRKLEADPQNPKTIKTVYGAGYMFSANVGWK
jgi:DNA-binding response OmpR family regulator